MTRPDPKSLRDENTRTNSYVAHANPGGGSGQQVVAQLVGHPGDVVGVAEVQSCRRLVAGQADLGAQGVQPVQPALEEHGELGLLRGEAAVEILAGLAVADDGGAEIAALRGLAGAGAEGAVDTAAEARLQQL